MYRSAPQQLLLTLKRDFLHLSCIQDGLTLLLLGSKVSTRVQHLCVTPLQDITQLKQPSCSAKPCLQQATYRFVQQLQAVMRACSCNLFSPP
jgi:hypothetical protein